MQPGMPYGVPGPSGMYPPAGQYLPMPQQHQNEQLRKFWKEQQEEIEQVSHSILRAAECLLSAVSQQLAEGRTLSKEVLCPTQVGTDPAEFKNHQLPLARIKKVRLFSAVEHAVTTSDS